MVTVDAIQAFNMQACTGIHREGMEEFLEELCIDIAHLVSCEIHAPDQIGAIAKIH